MGYSLSPAVTITEQDMTGVVAAVATTPGALVGSFVWGPINEVNSFSTEKELFTTHGAPDNDTYLSFFTAANFLSYASNLQVVRVAGSAAKNAVGVQTATVNTVTVGTAGSYAGGTVPVVTFTAPQTAGITTTGSAVMGALSATVAVGGTGYVVGDVVSYGGATFTVATVTSGAIATVTVTNAGTFTSTTTGAKLVTGGTGNGATLTILYKVLSITLINAGSGYTSAPTVSFDSGTAAATAYLSPVGGLLIRNKTEYDTQYGNGQAAVGTWAAKWAGSKGNSLKVSMADAASFSAWAYKDLFSVAPSTSGAAAAVAGTNDEMHVVVIDNNGIFSGVIGAVLETFPFVSKANDVKNSDGTSNYYKEVINRTSKYIWWMDHPAAGTNWGTTAANKTFAPLSTAETLNLSGGVDANTPTDGDLIAGYAIFSDAEAYDVALIPTGSVSQAVKAAVISLVDSRKDCVAFFSPTMAAVVNNIGNESTAVIAERNALSSTSYAVMDCNWKYQYDRYNDVYRWIPLNGDIAGLCARTDDTNDPWWSPAGYTRGQIKNVIRLAWNPSKTDRDNMYKVGINPVISPKGQGTVLFGDKTMLSKPSAFDRINVRRLFIVLEKSISTAAKYQLFEFNDVFSRAQFRNLVEPFLRDVQGRRGVTAYRVICDETNNTQQVVKSNEFVGDIYIRPNYSTNAIRLNFSAVDNVATFTISGA